MEDPFDPRRWPKDRQKSEILALAEGVDAAALRHALARMLATLMHARDASEARLGAKLAIGAALEFIRSIDGADLLDLDRPFEDLLTALYSLDRGAVEPVFAPAKRRGRPIPLDEVKLRAQAAAAAELRISAGDDLNQACQTVAERICSRHRVRGRHDRRIIGRTIRGWRDEAMQTKSPVRLFFKQWLDAMDREDPREAAEAVLLDLLNRRSRTES
jgi:hypothetical protein